MTAKQNMISPADGPDDPLPKPKPEIPPVEPTPVPPATDPIPTPPPIRAGFFRTGGIH